MGRGARAQRGRVGAVLLATAVLTAGCSGGSGKTDVASTARAVARNTTTLPVDELGGFFATAPVRKTLGHQADEILALMRSAHSAFLGKLGIPRAVPPAGIGGSTATTTGAAAGDPPPVVLTAVDLITTGAIFQTMFAELLDEATSGRLPAGGADLPVPSASASASNASKSAVVTGSATAHVQASGSVVTLRLDVSEHIGITDTATGATVIDSTSEYVLTGLIDVCPAANGTAAGSLDEQFTMTLAQAATGLSARSEFGSIATTTGHVDDSASLSAINGDFNWKEQNRSTIANGSPQTGSGTYGETLSVQTPGGTEDANSIDARATGQSLDGTATAADLNAASVSAAFLFVWMWPAYKEAQRLWRNGRCVVVAVPAYNAQTPIKIADQGTSQHTEQVGTGSQTKFTVQLKHRFGGPPRAPIDAAMTSGQVKLDPLHLDGAPGSLTYTAPNEPNKTATVDMKSTSRRGIGRLVITFETKPKDLQLSISGTLTTGISLAQVLAHVTVGPVTLTKTGDNTWEGDATLKTSYTLKTLPVPCAALGTETGTIHLTASRQTQGDTAVWIVNPDPARSHVSGQFTCQITVGRSFAGGGGYGVKFMAAVGTMTIPDAGGSLPVNTTRSLTAGLTDAVTGTITATVTEAG